MKIYVMYDIKKEFNICQLPYPLQSASFEIEQVGELPNGTGYVVMSYEIENELSASSEMMLITLDATIEFWYEQK